MILPTAYFASIYQFALQAKQTEVFLDGKEHFVKQSYRNRCEIYGANGKLSLIVPLKKWKNHSNTEDIKISFEDNWQHVHWKSIESAYRTSPFFEFFEEEIKPLIYNKEDNLFLRNLKITKELNALIGINQQISITDSYEAQIPDYRITIHPKRKDFYNGLTFKAYIQVFEEKNGFLPNLSILDLLFNLGTECKSYLNNVQINN